MEAVFCYLTQGSRVLLTDILTRLSRNLLNIFSYTFMPEGAPCLNQFQSKHTMAKIEVNRQNTFFTSVRPSLLICVFSRSKAFVCSGAASKVLGQLRTHLPYRKKNYCVYDSLIALLCSALPYLPKANAK